MAGLLDWFGPGGSQSQPPSTGTIGPIAMPNAIQPSDAAQPSFWNQRNPDGTSSYLGGLIRYNPAKDISGGNNFGLFGSALRDIGANLGGRPEDANNLANFEFNARRLAARHALQTTPTTGDTGSYLRSLIQAGVPLDTALEAAFGSAGGRVPRRRLSPGQ